MVRRAWSASSPGRSISRTNTASSPRMKVGTPQTLWSRGRGLVLLADDLERAAVVDRGEHGVGVDAVAGRGPRATTSRSRRSRPWSWRAAKRARCTSGRPRGRCRARRCRPGGRAARCRSSGRSQMSGSPSSTWTWPRENGTKRHVPVGAAGQAGEHVLVGVAGEGAAVVPGDGEGRSWCAQRHAASRAFRPDRRGSAPEPLGDARPSDRARPTAPPTTSDGVVDLHVDAAGGHHRGQAVLRPAPSRLSVARAAPAAQKAALAWPLGKLLVSGHAQVVGALELGDRALAAEQRLEHAVDEHRLDAEHHARAAATASAGCARRSAGRGRRR